MRMQGGGEERGGGIVRAAPTGQVPKRRGERISKGVFRPCHIACAHHQKRKQASVAFARDALGRFVRVLDGIDHWLRPALSLLRPRRRPASFRRKWTNLDGAIF